MLLVVLHGSGWLTTERNVADLYAGAIVWLPRRSHRQFAAGPKGCGTSPSINAASPLILSPTAPGQTGYQRPVPERPTS
jgi:hypothetical protein